jgi:hypothetical protein
MATTSGNKRLARHGLAEIRRQLRERFAGDLVLRDAVSHVLGSIIDEWDAREPVSATTAEQLANAIRGPIEALEIVPVRDAKPAAEQLARAWDDVRGTLVWG